MNSTDSNIDAFFEPAPPTYVLRAGDRMRRTIPESANSLAWFPIMSFDVGREVRYFEGGGFEVQKRKDDAPPPITDGTD